MSASNSARGIWTALALVTGLICGGCFEAEDYAEIKCGLSAYDTGSKLFHVRLESSDGNRKNLTFNNQITQTFDRVDGPTLYFRSTTRKHLKWTSDISEFEMFEYRDQGQDMGFFSATHKSFPEHIEFGWISSKCSKGFTFLGLSIR